MALQKTFTENVDLITVAEEYGQLSKTNTLTKIDCYVKVNQVNGTKNSVVAEVIFFVENVSKIKNYSFTPNMNGENFIKQAYLHLKTLPEFAGAQDC